MGIKLEILEYSYWEHFKYAKDLQLILPLGHKKRIRLQKDMDEILEQIHELKSKIIDK